MIDNIKRIFFDLGSTLVDESTAYRRRIENTIMDSGILYDDFYNKMLEYYCENKDGYKETVRYYGLKPAGWEPDDEVPYPDARVCLKAIKKMGLKIGIIANQSYGSRERLEKFGLLKYIDFIVASAEEGVEKPDPRIFEIALNRAGCEPTEAVMIGDRLDNDIVPAKILGMKTIWIKRGFSCLYSVRRSEERPDCIVNSLSEVPKILDGVRKFGYNGNIMAELSDDFHKFIVQAILEQLRAAILSLNSLNIAAP